MAAGNLGQFVYVAPDRSVVIVRLGNHAGDRDWPSLMAEIVAGL